MMHHGLEQAGLSRTVLHATPQGKPVYERMGYRVVSLFDIYAFGG